MKGLMKASYVVRPCGEDREGITKRVYVGVCAGSRSVGRAQNRWIDIVKKCLKKRGLDVRQAKIMVQDRSEWRGFVRGNA